MWVLSFYRVMSTDALYDNVFYSCPKDVVPGERIQIIYFGFA